MTLTARINVFEKKNKNSTVLCEFQIFLKISEEKKNPWQNLIGGGVCSDPGPGTSARMHTHSLANTHTDGGARESRAQNREEKKQRAESMLDERIRPLAKPSAASFFPFSLQLSLFLFLARRLSSSPRSFPNHCLSLCQHE